MDCYYSVEIFKNNVLIRDENSKVFALYDHETNDATKADINTLKYRIAKQIAIEVHKLIKDY